MKFNLAPNTKISAIKNQFAAFFPFLKLEFYQLHHRRNESSSTDSIFIDDLSLAELGVCASNSVFSFNPSTTIAEFEQGLQNGYNLPVQVFRRAGGVWLETVQSDYLTLQKQNEMGEQSLTVERYNAENEML
ncbi:MAG: hypothetical protein EON98_00095 [Chitinophagaceae bacterium]|nr:MAG: hypothetical protein EON98_00095 [Chitinophagaceae bacterium]